MIGIRQVITAVSREDYIQRCEAAIAEFRPQVDDLRYQYVYQQDAYRTVEEELHDIKFESSVTPPQTVTRWIHDKGGKKVGIIASYIMDGQLYMGVARCNPRDHFHPTIGLYKALWYSSLATDANLEERKKELPENYQAAFEHIFARSVPEKEDTSEIPF